MHERKNGETEYETDGKSVCLNGNSQGTGDGVTKVAPENCRYDVCLLGAVEQTPDWIGKGFSDAGNYMVIEIPHTAEAVALVWQEGIRTAMELGYEVDNQRPIIERYRKSKVDQGFCEFLISIK